MAIAKTDVRDLDAGYACGSRPARILRDRATLQLPVTAAVAAAAASLTRPRGLAITFGLHRAHSSVHIVYGILPCMYRLCVSRFCTFDQKVLRLGVYANTRRPFPFGMMSQS